MGPLRVFRAGPDLARTPRRGAEGGRRRPGRTRAMAEEDRGERGRQTRGDPEAEAHRRAPAPMNWTPAHLDELRALVGEDGVLASDAALFTYEADALVLDRARPDVVVLPRSSDEVAALVRWARA